MCGFGCDPLLFKVSISNSMGMGLVSWIVGRIVVWIKQGIYGKIAYGKIGSLPT
jgi:hypothetical protein